jgi:hypothetical protein
MFANMFCMPQPTANILEGTEKNPIELHNVDEDTFDIFVGHAYGE